MSKTLRAVRDDPARITLTIGVVACVIEVCVSGPLFFVRAPEIRPMKWVSETFLVAAMSALVALPFFVWAMWGSRRKVAALGLLLALAPLPLGAFLLKLAAWICGFTLED